MTVKTEAAIAARSSTAAATVKRRTSRNAIDQERRPSKVFGTGVESVGFEDITNTPNGLDHLFLERVIHLGPQTTHHNIDDVSSGIKVNVPDLFDDLGA